MGAALVRGFPRRAARHRHLPSGQSGISVADGLDAKAKIRFRQVGGDRVAYPDTLVGTDSHTTMVNGLAVLGWGVGGIEAEAAMLGQPYSMLLPEVIGVRLNGKLKEGVTATDLVLTVTQMLRKQRRGRQVRRIFRSGSAAICRSPTAPRSAICRRNTAQPAASSRSTTTPSVICATPAARPTASRSLSPMPRRKACTAPSTPDPVFTDVLKLELSSIEPSLAGPKRPQDRIALKEVKSGFAQSMDKEFGKAAEMDKRVPVEGRDFTLGHGDVVIAAITSCTNTSNPSVMVGAGLLARKAVSEGPQGEAVGQDFVGAGFAGRR